MAKSRKTSTGAKSAVGASQPEAPIGAPDGAVQARAPDPAVAVSVQVRKKEIVDRVALRSGAKRAVARDMTEAVLGVLSEALARGETLVLPPLGKIAVQRQADKPTGEVLHLKLKRIGSGTGAKKDAESAQDPLAEPED
ncbi:hypothetical protein CKO11_11810 [Rhodobacter sp. TJ_12]|uniref:HU family DNA-binding protein n=1 Tax=Rhodobacter sp. TJ_12 TaxID=2029399 RepID=UPI001CBDB1F5|nr:HU family DNA-binding protein [Rhodobacter sp. TJ_12]MBZ4023145.1 hypothetical protein [Rhodobacter sp. TJ_12]